MMACLGFVVCGGSFRVCCLLFLVLGLLYMMACLGFAVDDGLFRVCCLWWLV